MADKKITALTALTATGKVSSTDLLHIIDYSASPVNKKITVSDIFSNANTAISSYGAFTHDLGPTNAISGLSVVVPNATPAASAETEVIVNDDGNAFVDFRVETGLSVSALKVDSSLDTDNGSCNTVTINGDFAKVDFRVNSDTSTATTPLIHCDSTDHAIGIGKEDPDTAYLMDFADVSGKSIKTAGSIDVTGSITATGNLTVTGFLVLNDTIATAIAGGANVGAKVEIPITDLVTHLDPGSSTGHYGLANGAAGQIKIIFNSDAAETATITPTSFAQGTTLTLQTKESSTLMYTTGGWIVLNHPGSAIT